MARALLVGLMAVLALVPVASASGFKDKRTFETYVAGYLHVRSVSCAKLNARIADCLGSDHHRYVVACAAPGGNRCTIRRYA